MLNLPNIITLSRIALVVVFTVLLSLKGGAAENAFASFAGGAFPGGSPFAALALAAFILAAASDWLDGYLARRLGQVTTFGKLIDPLADKILVSTAFIYLTRAGYCPFWVTALIICREFLVTGLRQIVQSRGHVMAADRLGKWKTACQLAYCIACLLHLACGASAGAAPALLIDAPFAVLLRGWLLAGATLLTLWSGLNYCVSAHRLLKG